MIKSKFIQKNFTFAKIIIWMKNFLIVLIFIALLFSCQNNHDTETSKKGFEKNMNETLAEINKKIQKDPSNPSLYVDRSQYYILNGQINEALESLQKAVELDSLNFDAWNNIVDIYMLTGRYLDCESAMYHLLKLDPNNTTTLLKLAKYYTVIQNYEESQTYIKQVFKLDEHNAQAYYVQGINFVEQGDTGLAVKNFIQSIELDPNFYDSQLHLAIIYESRDNPLAAEYYKNAIRIRPQHLPTQYSLGMFYQEHLHQPERALTVYNTILKQDSTFVTAWYNIGYIYLVYYNDPKQALRYFDKTIQLQPNYVEALYNTGYCHELLQEIDNARFYYQQSLNYNPDFTLALQRLTLLEN